MLSVCDLRNLRLTLDEWSTLHSMASRDFDPSLIGGPMRNDIDTLVLAGLLERQRSMTEGGWIDRWAMTENGRAAATMIDKVFDWDEFAYVCDWGDDKTEPFADVINLQIPMFV